MGAVLPVVSVSNRIQLVLFMGSSKLRNAIAAVARWELELQRQNNSIPKQHHPIIEVVRFRERLESVVENAGILSVVLSIEQDQEAVRWFLAGRDHFASFWHVLWNECVEVGKIQTTDYLPTNAEDSIAFKPLRNQIWRKNQTARSALKLVEHFVEECLLLGMLRAIFKDFAA